MAWAVGLGRRTLTRSRMVIMGKEDNDDADLGDVVDELYRAKGVEVLSDQTVTAMTRQGERFVVRVSGGRDIPADGVVAGLGVLPNVEIASRAGLKVENGIAVDQFLQTSDPDVYAAGDVAYFHNPALNKSTRVEHVSVTRRFTRPFTCEAGARCGAS